MDIKNLVKSKLVSQLKSKDFQRKFTIIDYKDKSYIKMLGCSKEIDLYHHHQQFIFEIKEHNENDRAAQVFWAVS